MTEEDRRDLTRRVRRNRRLARAVPFIALTLASMDSVLNAVLWNEIQHSRSQAIGVTCRIDNRQNAALRVMILQGAQSSRIFEDLYRSHGAPPYRVRVRQAERMAETLPLLDCRELLRSVQVPTR